MIVDVPHIATLTTKHKMARKTRADNEHKTRALMPELAGVTKRPTKKHTQGTEILSAAGPTAVCQAALKITAGTNGGALITVNDSTSQHQNQSTNAHNPDAMGARAGKKRQA